MAQEPAGQERLMAGAHPVEVNDGNGIGAEFANE
jgi:hypothetical protein